MRRWWRWIAGVTILFLLLSAGGGYLMWKAHEELWNPKDPVTVVKRAVAGTLQSPSFSFESTFLIRVDGREEVISRFSGDRAEGEKFHLKGTLLQSPAEIYTVGNLFYLWDPVKKSWYTIEKNRFGPQDLLLSEISPLTALDIKTIEGVTVAGIDSVDEDKCLLMECRTEVSNRLLATLWKDFYYRIWVDPKKNLIRKVVVEATSRNAPRDRLILTLRFWDYSGKQTITLPPVATR
ncbi:hypothetical protein HM1_0060 [Heliomicrobium modesticaldum Ice1]|uniref:Uncharacterized protein n=1 Tax=Heliobacterium modesticaldum (strain ATCC 51547 / Ice1) TaxID=498761 RepID=B0TI12_HELMI|nr:hypothetical protein [Heliomicrobium modesticaldum]ABZ82685.1 hypothetical protein HM1_0060 [Heliomicrobium modesticaldum Ice1]